MSDPNDVIGYCPKCQASIRRNHPYAWCSQCGTPLPAELQAILSVPVPRVVNVPTEPTVSFRHFRSSMSRWETLFGEAAAFATHIGRERVINISHSESADDGVVTVWYWSE